MATQIQIFNRTLYLLKQRRVANPVNSVELTDVYDSIRDEVLEARPWNFAKAWASLAKDTANTSWQYAYSYTLPADPWCLAVQQIEDTKAKFEVGAGRKLYTDEGPPLKIAYTARITDESRFSGPFTAALVLRLALETGPQIADISSARFAALENRYYRVLQNAATRDGQEGNHLEYEDSDYLEARI